jgi:hypothetical protein
MKSSHTHTHALRSGVSWHYISHNSPFLAPRTLTAVGRNRYDCLYDFQACRLAAHRASQFAEPSSIDFTEWKHKILSLAHTSRHQWTFVLTASNQAAGRPRWLICQIDWRNLGRVGAAHRKQNRAAISSLVKGANGKEESLCVNMLLGQGWNLGADTLSGAFLPSSSCAAHRAGANGQPLSARMPKFVSFICFRSFRPGTD